MLVLYTFIFIFCLELIIKFFMCVNFGFILLLSCISTWMQFMNESHIVSFLVYLLKFVTYFISAVHLSIFMFLKQKKNYYF